MIKARKKNFLTNKVTSQSTYHTLGDLESEFSWLGSQL